MNEHHLHNLEECAQVIENRLGMSGSAEGLRAAARELRRLSEQPDPAPMLAEDNRRMRTAGGELAEAAMRVVTDFDGVHRLARAVSRWADTVAGEGGRAKRFRVVRYFDGRPIRDRDL